MSTMIFLLQDNHHHNLNDQVPRVAALLNVRTNIIPYHTRTVRIWRTIQKNKRTGKMSVEVTVNMLPLPWPNGPITTIDCMHYLKNNDNFYHPRYGEKLQNFRLVPNSTRKPRYAINFVWIVY